MLRCSRIGAAALAVLALTLTGNCFGAAGGDERFYPQDTEVIVHVNVRQILNSELVKKNKTAMERVKDTIQNMIEMDAQANKYIKALGFDAFRDLDSVTSVMPGNADPTKGLIIIRGRFDTQKFGATAEEAAKNHGDVLKLTKSGKFQVVEVSPPGEDKTFYIALVNSGTLLVAHSKDTMTTALSRESATQGTALPKEVKDLVTGYDPKQSLSFVATSKALAKIAQSQAQQKQEVLLIIPLLRTLNGFNGTVDARKDVHFQIGIVTQNGEEAKKLSQTIGGGIGAVGDMVATKAENDAKLRPWVDVIKSVRANSQNSTVMIRGQIPAAVIEQVLKEQFNR